MRASYWEPSGIQMGYCYEGSPICIEDGSVMPDTGPRYVQNARPGARAPHAWLNEGRSTLDLFGHGFVLLQLSGVRAADARAIDAAARERGIPVNAHVFDNKDLCNLYAAPLVLIRPDGHVAWRGDSVEDARRIIDTVRGAA
jgi:hypothetical protein